MLLKLTLQWIILCRLLKGGMQLRLKTLLYDAGCSSEEFLTRRSWKLVCFTQIPDVVFTHTKRTNAKVYIHIHPTSLVVGGLVPDAWCTSVGLLEPIIENALRRQFSCPEVLRLARDLHRL